MLHNKLFTDKKTKNVEWINANSCEEETFVDQAAPLLGGANTFFSPTSFLQLEVYPDPTMPLPTKLKIKFSYK